MNLDHAEVFAALAIAGVAALWRAASLRGDMRKDWSSRVEDAEIGLADRATSELLAMQREIAGLMGSGSSLLPRLATVDPAQLATRIGDFQKTLSVASRLASDFRWLLRIGPLLIVASAAFLLGLGGLFADNSELASSESLRIGRLAVGGIGVVLGLAALVAWVFIHQRLSGAEMRAAEEIE